MTSEHLPTPPFDHSSHDSDRHASDTDAASTPEADAELQRQILSGRKFSLADVIGREGSDFMKGVSPVPPLMQAIAAINLFISKYLPDSSGALHAILYNWVKSEEGRISRHIETPLQALHEIVESILQSSHSFYEFVRQVDCKWGEMNDERPYFQRPGQAPHPDDEYTHDSVYQQLRDFQNFIDQVLADPSILDAAIAEEPSHPANEVE